MERKHLACPLSGSKEIRLIETLPVPELIDLYRRDYGIDTAAEFRQHSDIGFYHCPTSDLNFFYPMVTGSESFYEGLQKFDWYYQESKFEFDFVSRFIKETDHVLEVGSGKGMFREKIGAKNYTGLEFSLEAKKLAAARGTTILNESIEGHAECNAGRYDVVCSFQVLEHVAQVRSFIESCIACLKPGGLLIYSVPSADSYIALASNSILNMPPHHVSWWSDACLEYLANIFDLEIIAIEHERLAEIHRKSYAAFIALQAFKNVAGIRASLLDRSFKYRLASKLAGWTGRFLEKGLLNPSMLPVGQSVTAIYRKAS